ncbi:MAG: Lrp/AsnC family transcriptional regulator [Paracoccaceae bacterium]|nr:transcriptional regulator, AsnC family protein [Rhodobacterales bacterium HTCC2150] [Rhodobacteraceae bacterium HTCC2150]MDG1530883.1 Lrp/AsnC family transcriptional regulator [Paracoccaceae bacterium]
MALDEIDKRLLSLLQKDAHLTAQEMAETLNLSSSQAGRRRQRLEADGYIKATIARLDARKLGLTVQAFVQIQMAAHGAEPVRQFKRMVALQPEIIHAWTLTGDADYLLRIYCTDLAALNALIQDVLLPHPAIARVQSQIVMDQLKIDAPLPL